MNTPDWLKPCLYGAAIGAAALSIFGFSWAGWMTAGTANEMAMEVAHDNVVTAMVPVCLDMARTDPDRTKKLAAIRDASTYQRRDALIEAGWATMPGADVPNREIAGSCIAALDVDNLPEQTSAPADSG